MKFACLVLYFWEVGLVHYVHYERDLGDIETSAELDRQIWGEDRLENVLCRPSVLYTSVHYGTSQSITWLPGRDTRLDRGFDPSDFLLLVLCSIICYVQFGAGDPLSVNRFLSFENSYINRCNDLV